MTESKQKIVSADMSPERLVSEQKRIAEIGRLVASTLDVSSIYPQIGSIARELVAADRMVIAVFTDDESELIDLHIDGVEIEGSVQGSRHPARKDEIYEQVFIKRIPFHINYEALDKYQPESDEENVRRSQGLRSLLLLPLTWQERSYGILSFRAYDPDAFTPHSIELAEQIANQIAGAFATSTQYAELERETRERAELAEIRRIAGSSLDIGEFFAEFAEHTRKLVPADRVVLGTFSGDGAPIQSYVDGLDGDWRGSANPFPPGTDNTLKDALGNTSILVLNGAEYEKFIEGKPAEQERYSSGLRSLLAIPLFWRGELVGGLTFRSVNPDAYTAKNIDLAKHIADQVASAVHASNQYWKLRAEARQRELLAEIGRIASSALDIGSVFTPLAEAAHQLIPFDRFSILEVDSPTGEVYSAHVTGRTMRREFEPGPFQVNTSAVPKQVYEDQQVLIANVDKLIELAGDDPADVNRMMIEAGLVSAIFVPIVLQGTTVGTLLFRSLDNDIYGESDAVLGIQIAALISGVIASNQQRKLIQSESVERRRLAEEQTALAELGRIVNSPLELSEVFELFMKEARKLVPFDRVVILTLNEDKTEAIDYLVGGQDDLGDLEQAVLDLEANPFQKRSTVGGEQIVLTGEGYTRAASEVPAEMIRLKSGLKSALMTPMIWQDEAIGGINFRSVKDDAYGEHEAALAKQMSALLAGAIASSDQVKQLERQALERRREADERARLAEIGRVASSSLDIFEVFNNFVEQAQGLLPFDRAVMIVLTDDKTRIGHEMEYGVGQHLPGVGENLDVRLNELQSKALTSGEQLMLSGDDFVKKAAKIPSEQKRVDDGFKSVLWSPVMWQGSAIGLVTLRSMQEDAFGEHEMDLAQQITTQIAGSIANSIQYSRIELESRERRRLAEEQMGIAEIGRTVSSTLDLDEVFNRFVGEARSLVPFDRLVISLNDPDGKTATDVFVSGEIEDGGMQGDTFVIGNSIKESVMLTNESLVANEAEYRKLAQQYPAEKSKFDVGYRSLMVVPLAWQSELIGTLIFRSLESNPYGDHEKDLAGQIGAQIAGAVSGSNQYRLLQESERIYRDLVESANILVWRMDTEGHFTFVNKSLEQALGYTADEMIGKHYVEFRPEDEREAALERLKQRGFNRLPRSGDTRYISKDGMPVHLWFTSYPMFDSDGNFTGVRGTALDVTAERVARDELKIQSTALEEASDAVIILLPDTTIGYVNNAVVEQLGYSKEEIIGQPSSILRSPESNDAAYEQIWDKVRGGEIWRGTVLSARKNGETFSVDASLNPVFAQDGSITSYVSIRRDITERLQAEQDRQARAELDARNQQLQEINSQREEFFSSVSHELRTPLTAVTAFSDILSRNREDNLTKSQLDQLDVIRRNSRSLINLVEDMLDMSRLNSKSLRIDRIPVQVDDFVESTVESLGPTTRERNQTIKVNSGTEDVWLDADKDRLVQVLSNLITNASKYSPDGADIEIGTEICDGWVEVVVADSGFGMSRSELQMLFSPFYRSERDEIRTQTGTGLGMSISKNLIELHDGEIEVESKINVGTKVKIRLPNVVPPPKNH